MLLKNTKRYALDTNILVYLTDSSSPYYSWCRNLIDENGGKRNLFVTEKSLFEFYTVISNLWKKHNNYLELCFSAYESVRTEGAWQILCEKSTPETVSQFLQQKETRGKYIHDLVIAAILFEHNVDGIITNNPKDFQDFDWLDVVTPEIS